MIAVHMDWPTYPEEHGADVALRSLGLFPEGTTFRQLDDCDRCVLFLAQVPGETPPSDPMIAPGRHVAVWHEDLQELHAAGLATGLVFCSEGVWRRNRHDAMLGEVAARNGVDVSPVRLGIQLPSGEWQPIEPPEVDDDHDDDFPADEGWPNWKVSADLGVSPAGFRHLRRLLKNGFRVPPSLQPRLLPLLQANLYDTGIREMALHLEVAMKSVLGAEGYQRDVTGRYVNHVRQSDRFLTALVLWHEVEVRTAMKWVRNEFAHNVIDVEPAHSYAVLSRLCELIATVEEVEQALRERV